MRTRPVATIEPADGNVVNSDAAARADAGPPCSICAEPTGRHCQAICNGCGSLFHLALREDIPCKDCGQVWLNEEYMALEFVCNTCLGVAPPPAAESATPAKRRYVRHEGKGANAVARTRRRT